MVVDWRPEMPHFNRHVLLPVVIVTLSAVLLVALGLWWAAARSDAISIERQVRETRQAISSSLDDLALNQQTIAVWDDPLLELKKDEPDWQWFDENFGTWLHDLFGHNQVYILDARDMPIYAAIEGIRVLADKYRDVQNDLRPLIESVRGHSTEENDQHERLPGRPLHPDATVRTGEKAVHATRLINARGRPAAASVMKIVPLTEKVGQMPGAEPLLISIRFLDGAFLQELAKRNLIDAPRFSWSSNVDAGEKALALVSHEGAQIGYFIWRPELPGSQLMRSLAPVTTVAIGVMIVIMSLLATWLYKAMREQQAITYELRDAMIDLQASEKQLRHLAFHDPLTDLPNRANFFEYLDGTIACAKEDGSFAVLLLDVDRFKSVNDTFGHLAGDMLICEFARRLTDTTGEDGVVARLSGDEFAILWATIGPEHTEALCNRILETIRHPFDLQGKRAYISTSIGAAIAEPASSRMDLLRKADIALYRAKAEGRDRCRLFTPEMDEELKLRRVVEDELRNALVTGQGLRLHYQPQVAGPNHTIVGLEALMRWQHPTRGLISPAAFISVAEETGLICQLGEWALREACAVSRRWPHLFMAVNFSPMQVRAPGFAERVLNIVRTNGADPHRIEIEVTESVLLDDNDDVRDGLRKLRAAGVRIALDDFGTGYSSLSYLRRFEVDKIKIDRSFVEPVWHARNSGAIVTAVLTLGQAMGLTVVAEGVETVEQRQFLTAANCDLMQGFLFSRPLPENEIDKLITVMLSRGAA